MNSHELNQAELNGSFTHNVIVGLGTASATIEFVAYERSLAFLSGTTGLSTSVLGDITKYSQIGFASSGIEFNHYAALASFTEVNIPSGESGISFTESGVLYTQAVIPEASSSIDFDVAGDLYVVGDLIGSTGLTFSITSASGPQITKLLGDSTANIVFEDAASLTQYIIRSIPDAISLIEFESKGALTQFIKSYIPNAVAPLTFTAAGDLTNYGKVYLSGAANLRFSESAYIQANINLGSAPAAIVFETTANLMNKQTKNLGVASAGFTLTAGANVSSIKKLSGTSGIDFTTSANILNNPTAIDPPAFVLTRPFVDRVMVRQS